jgi:hypothetical protein
MSVGHSLDALIRAFVALDISHQQLTLWKFGTATWLVSQVIDWQHFMW